MHNKVSNMFFDEHGILEYSVHSENDEWISLRAKLDREQALYLRDKIDCYLEIDCACI